MNFRVQRCTSTSSCFLHTPHKQVLAWGIREKALSYIYQFPLLGLSTGDTKTLREIRCYIFIRIRDSSVGIATGYWWYGQGSIHSRSTHWRSNLGTTQPPIQCTLWDSSPGQKRPGCEAAHSLLSTAVVTNGGVITPLPHMPSLLYFSIAWRLRITAKIPSQ
jgi:hypothetical protein